MRELLGFEADAGVELDFDPLTALRLDPFAVDTLVLLVGPEILAYALLETFLFQTSDVSPDALSVAILGILKREPDRV